MSSSIVSEVFSSEDLDYLMNLPEVIAAKAKLRNSSDAVYFSIPVTETIRAALYARLGLDLSTVSEIPMRWIKGDTAPHIDSGAKKFENTYLVYLNDSPGSLVLETTEYSITANTGFIFNEGLSHKTLNTGIVPRLLLGPMNEFIQPVGATIAYYTNYADAFAQNNNSIAVQGNTWILGDLANIGGGSIGSYTSWRVAKVDGNASPTGVYSNGFDLATLGFGGVGFYVYAAAPCFKEGTKILCQIGGVETYVRIETIEPGTLVKTSRDGFKKVEIIAKGDIQNSSDTLRTENRLYKCSPKNYPELKEDLYITGCHSILVDTLTDEQKEKTKKHLGKIFITDKKYRLMACIDERAEPWNSAGHYTIWHLALENPDVKMNYGVYANGLLVETCSINFLKNRSNMVGI